MQGTVYSPDFGQVVNVRVDPLPDDSDAAVAATIRRMVEYAVEDSGSPIVERALLSAVPVDGFTPLSLLAELHSWVRSHVRFEEDDDTAGRAGFGSGNELLIRPVDLLRMPRPVEDCDGISMLAAALVLAAGRLLKMPYRVLYVTIAANPRRPDEFSHVYVYVVVEGRQVSFDGSHGPYLGWEYRTPLPKKAVWPVGAFMFARRMGRLGRLGQDSSTVLDPSAIDTTPIIETTYPGLPAGASAPGGGINWNALLQTAVSAGAQIGKQLTLPTGAYVATGPGGQIMANQVPGAVPGGFNFGANTSGLLPVLAIGGLGLLAVAAFSRGRG